LALAWLLAQPLDVVSILGTKRANYVQETLTATNIAVSVDKVVYLADIFSPNPIVRNAPTHSAHVEAAPDH
jgi:aryl-alcohol dehydrogenase-like predicted oxidoreductase